MNKLLKNLPIIILGASLLVSTPAFAQGPSGGGDNRGPNPFSFFHREADPGNNTARPTPNDDVSRGGSEREASFGARPIFRESSSSGRQFGQMRSCQARENAIKQRSSHLIELVNNMIATFDTIAGRVETYYTSKLTPSGKVVSNYDSLVSDIQTKKAAVQAALVTAQNDQNSFSCSAADPKSEVSQFNTQMRSVKQSLQDYRTSIKNLIVAVHSVVGEENKTASGSAQQQ